MQPEVRSLTSAIASGDTEAFARYFRQWFDPMQVEARRVCGRDESFCLDVVQDAMMRVIRSLRPMDTEDDLRRWLNAVVYSCAMDRLRREAAATRAERCAQERAAAAPPRDRRERLEWIEERMRGLDDAEQRLLLMRYRFGWTLQRIARALQLKPGTIDGRLRRLLVKLRRLARERTDE